MALRFGGVPEHFSAPIQLCLSKGLLSDNDLSFLPQPSGTGEMIARLNSGELDVAVALTEGLVMATTNGTLRDSEIVCVFVTSPLEWGVHTNGTKKDEIRSVQDLNSETCRIAISRPLSGSHLMSFCFCDQYGWNPEKLTFVPCGGLRGTLAAFEEDKVDLFLWDRYMTVQCVESGALNQIGVVKSPWPCFCVCARKEILETRGEELKRMIELILAEGRKMADSPEETIAFLKKEYNLEDSVANEWLATTRFAESVEPLPESVAEKIRQFMPSKDGIK